jgi:hypothetical protein
LDKIEQALSKFFDKHRIVFWYDEKQELHQDFDELWLGGVEKIELAGNEFSPKHRILSEAPTLKLLCITPIHSCILWSLAKLRST